MAKALGSVFSHTDALVKTWDFGAATPKGTLAVKNGVVGVSLTDTVGVTRTDLDITLYGNVKISGIRQPGVGNDKATTVGTYAAGAAIDGTWEFDSIVSTGTTPVPVTTAQGVPVFLTGAGALTLDSSGNTRIGVVNYPASYVKVAGKLPIAIGL